METNIELSGSLIAPYSQLKMMSANPSLDLVTLINQHRDIHHQLKLNLSLTKAAIEHAEDMATHHFQDHVGSDGSLFWQRILRYQYNYRWAGEIIGSYYPDANSMVEGWLNSRPHHAIMLDNRYTDIGPCGSMNADGVIYWVCDLGSAIG